MTTMGYRIREHEYITPTVHWEKDFHFDDGQIYNVIYGHHGHDLGGFIAIPDLHIICDADEYPYSADDNRDSMISVGVSDVYASAIAEYIENYNVAHREKFAAVDRDEDQRYRSYMTHTLRQLESERRRHEQGYHTSPSGN